MHKGAVRFALGFAVGVLAMLCANVMPYWQTYHAYDGDGYGLAGFPFTFRKVGGYVGIHRFSSHLLLADIAIALAVAVCFGVIAIRLLDGSRPWGRGFDLSL